MQLFVRRLLVPAMAAAAVTLSASAAGAFVGQPKPELKVEGERSPQGARLTFKGKNWPANARLKLTGTVAPGTNVDNRDLTVLLFIPTTNTTHLGKEDD